MVCPATIVLVTEGGKRVRLEASCDQMDQKAWLNSGQLYPPDHYTRMYIELPGGEFPVTMSVQDGLLEFELQVATK